MASRVAVYAAWLIEETAQWCFMVGFSTLVLDLEPQNWSQFEMDAG